MLANRLSADPRNRVLLIEAGGKDDWIWFHIPVGYLYAIGNPRADWIFRTAAEPGLNGRAIAYPRGHVIGGCSAINGMIYMRGQAADYDGWRQLGLEGWGWDDVLPFFLRHEDHHAGPSELHGAGGEWRVERPRIPWPILDAVREAAAEIGIPKIDDFNRGDNEGSAYFEVNQRRGRRWSAAHGVPEADPRRPNLQRRRPARMPSASCSRARARPASPMSRDGTPFEARARGEVLLAAGAIGTPRLMEISGIGRPEAVPAIGARLRPRAARGRRESAGSPAIAHDLPHRGRAHAERRVPVALQARRDGRSTMRCSRRGPLTMAPSQLGMFAKSSPDYDTANVEFHVQPLSLDRFGDPLHDFPAITLSVCNLRPTSLGSTHARAPTR